MNAVFFVRSSSRKKFARGFTLIEMLFVIAIIMLLASLLFPVFFMVRSKARGIVCASNLRQIGLGMAQYVADYDGYYPYAVDPLDRAAPELWDSTPEFAAAIPHLPMLQDALNPYVKSPPTWRCPSDIGFVAGAVVPTFLEAHPSSFEQYGTSYFYFTALAAAHVHESVIPQPANVDVLHDLVATWHGTFEGYQTSNFLFADGHVKNLSPDSINKIRSDPGLQK